MILPSFAWTPAEALEVAARAEEVGVDGVFCYDHLWPMGDPSRPALAPFPILSVVADRHPELFVSPLVARIGMVDDEVLCGQFRALAEIAPGRVIAAMGTGDKLSAAENLAYGIPFGPADERRASLRSNAIALLDEGIEVWIGGGAPPTVAIAEELPCALNMFQATPTQLAEQATRSEVTWAGLVPTTLDLPVESWLETRLSAVASSGASWAVVGWPCPLEVLAAGSQG